MTQKQTGNMTNGMLAQAASKMWVSQHPVSLQPKGSKLVCVINYLEGSLYYPPRMRN